MYKKIKADLFPILIIFLVSLIIVLPYADKRNIIANGESASYINPYMFNFFTTWEDKLNLGFVTPHQNNFSLFNIIWPVMSLLSLIINPSALFLFLSFFLSGSFFYITAKYFFRPKKTIYLLPASLLYSFNPFRLLGPMNEKSIIFFIFLPLFFLFYQKLLYFKKWRYVFLLTVFSFLSSSLGGNLPVFLLLYMVPFFYLIYFFLTEKNKDVKTIVKMNFVLFILIFFINLFWLAPLMQFLFNVYKASQAGENIFSALNAGSFFDHFRFMGQWAWRAKYYTSYYYPFSLNFDKPFFLITTFFIPLLFILNYVLKYNNKRSSISIFIILLASFSLIMLAGTKGPLGFIYQFLYTYFPPFRMYREPFTKFTFVFIFAVSMGFCEFMSIVETKLANTNKLISLIMITLLSTIILLNVYPYFTTEAIPLKKWNAGPAGYLVRIPNYWGEAKSYIDKDKSDSRLAIYPHNTYGTMNLWEYGVSVSNSIPDFLLDKKLLKSYDTDITSISNYIKEEFQAKNTNINFKNLLSLFNIRYLLQENDLEWRYSSKSIPPPSIANNYLLNNQLKPQKTFGFFDKQNLDKILNNEPDLALRNSLYAELTNKPSLILYNLDEKYFVPHLYIPSQIFNFSNNQRLPYIISSKNYNIGSAIIFRNQITTNREPIINFASKYIASKKATLEFKKINSTKYRVIIHNFKSQIPIVLTENFHPLWKAYIPKTVFTKPNTEKLGEDLKKYTIFDNNEKSQATIPQLVDFISLGQISTLGNSKLKSKVYYTYIDGFKKKDRKETFYIDYISKKYYNSIQNNNLKNDDAIEEWTHLSIPDKYHFEINGFANAWLIDPKELCLKGYACYKDSQGFYTLEMVIEFTPQKYFDIAFRVSLFIFFSLIVFLLLGLFKKTHNITKHTF